MLRPGNRELPIREEYAVEQASHMCGRLEVRLQQLNERQWKIMGTGLQDLADKKWKKDWGSCWGSLTRAPAWTPLLPKKNSKQEKLANVSETRVFAQVTADRHRLHRSPSTGSGPAPLTLTFIGLDRGRRIAQNLFCRLKFD